MVKPGGTGKPRLAISARLAPLPPSRSRRPALPSALPSPKVNTHLPDFTASVAGLLATILATGLAGVFARLFFSALRAVADGAAFAPGGADGFDFTAVFFDLATALAMTDNHPQRGGEVARLTPLWAVPRKVRRRVSTLHVEPLQEPKADQAVENQEDRDHQIEQPRHDQNQQARDHGHDRRNVSDGQGHLKRLRDGCDFGAVKRRIEAAFYLSVRFPDRRRVRLHQ